MSIFVRPNDAEIKFASTSGEKTRYDGSRITWQSGAWTEAEIEVLDVALASLHQRTGNTNLLKTSKGKTITFYRVGSSSNTAIGGWNDGSDVYITENRMDSDGNGAQRIAMMLRKSIGLCFMRLHTSGTKSMTVGVLGKISVVGNGVCFRG